MSDDGEFIVYEKKRMVKNKMKDSEGIDILVSES